MPELKALPPGAVKGFTAAAVDLETIKYSDKVREKARVVRLAAKKEERAKELEQKSNPKQQLSGGGEAKGKQAAASKVQPTSDSDRDGESDDGGSVSSNGSGSSSSQDSSKPAAVKRKRKGRKKVTTPALASAFVCVHACLTCNLAAPSSPPSVPAAITLNAAQGAEGAWSIKKAKAEAKRKRKVPRPCPLPFCPRVSSPVHSPPAGVPCRREVQAGRRSRCRRWRHEVKRVWLACSFGV